MSYRLIDHTADLGIVVQGDDEAAIFENTAHAMFDLITDIRRLDACEKLTIQVAGADRVDLMVNWLRELLYLWNGKHHLLKQATIILVEERKLTANLLLDPFDPGRHMISNEIKAVTYHQAYVMVTRKGWEAGVIFDV
jgi:SHS2 domain-containing protein